MEQAQELAIFVAPTPSKSWRKCRSMTRPLSWRLPKCAVKTSLVPDR